MAKNRKPRARPVHSSIKIALGYDPNLADQEVLQDWSERKRRVCKPCWELKYCPYGPLVEQSPLVPPLRSGMIEQNAYFRKCLETDMVGDVRALTEELRAEYREWLEDDQLLLRQALHEVRSQHALEDAARAPDEQQQIAVWLGGDIPPIHIYRAPFDHSQPEIREEDFSGDFWQELLSAVERIKQKYRDALVTGVDDYRYKLEPVRRAWFERQLDNFDPENYPEEVAETFQEAECNIFGHVCPVFFAAESVTETQEARRIGRHQLPFATMMRIVRRDDYRCQHCKKRLRESYADNRGIRIHYRVEGEGPPLVLQHGFTQSIDDWYEFGYVDALKRDYRLILVDARGHGQSDKPHDPNAYGLDNWVADVTSVADAMGVAKAHFWGYSMGGWIGFGMAKYAPDRVDRLVIGGSHPYARDQSPARQFFRPHLGDSNDEFISALENWFGARVSTARKARWRAIDGEAWLALSQDRPELSDILAGMRMPTCLYAGDADPLCPQAKAASQLIPGAAFFSLPGLTHLRAFQTFDVVLPKVVDFLGGGSATVS